MWRRELRGLLPTGQLRDGHHDRLLRHLGPKLHRLFDQRRRQLRYRLVSLRHPRRLRRWHSLRVRGVRVRFDRVPDRVLYGHVMSCGAHGQPVRHGWCHLQQL